MQVTSEHPARDASPRSRTAAARAYAVHAFTASGALAGLLSLDAIASEDWRAAFIWMGVALFIDGVDGTLARWVRIKEAAPGFDGALLDNVVDFFTYVIVPAIFMYHAQLLPEPFARPALALMVLASAYQFCQGDAKTPDHYFKGFPSYWNIVAFYFFFLNVSPWLKLGGLIGLSLLVFVPILYIYPSRTPRWRWITVALTLVWCAMVVWAVLGYPADASGIVALSLLYVVYYLFASVFFTLGSRRMRRLET